MYKKTTCSICSTDSALLVIISIIGQFCITIRNPLAIKCIKLVLDGVTYTYLYCGYNTPSPKTGSGGKL